MHEDDHPGFWASMFSQFRQRADKDAVQFIGQMIAMRCTVAPEMPAELSDLLARLKTGERDPQGTSGDDQRQVLSPDFPEPGA